MTGSAIKAVDELGVGAVKNNIMKTGKGLNLDSSKLKIDTGKTLDLTNPLPNIKKSGLF